jgi:uncharacterized protein involved in outer membrane biogenesis
VIASGNCWLPWIVKGQVKSRTGFNADIGSSRGSLFKGYIDFRDFSISNPKDAFTARDFLSLNELAADIKLRSLPTNTIVLERIVIDIDNITLVKNANGAYNCQLFVKNISKENQGNNTAKINDNKADDKSTADEKVSKKVPLGKVLFAIKSAKIIDESVEGSVKEFSLNYRREFSNIDDISDVIKPLISDLSKYGLSVLIQSTFDSILRLPVIEQATGGLINAKDVSKDVIEDIGGGFKGLFK